MKRSDRIAYSNSLIRKLNKRFLLTGKVSCNTLSARAFPEILEGCHGRCFSPDGRGRIKIVLRDYPYSADTLTDLLIHEYAHALRYNECPDHRREHGAAWGVAFARVYCAVHGEPWERETSV